MGTRKVTLSLVLLAFLIPLSIFNIHAAHGVATPNNTACPQSSQTNCEFNYSDFSSTNGITLNGNVAITSGSILRLTSSIANQAGSAWYNIKQNVSEGFSTIFRFQIIPSGGGDGFAFVIQNNGTASLGNSGLGLGYQGIPKSVAVEFDTYQNGAHLFELPNLHDVSDHEIAIHTKGLSPNSADETNAIPPGPVSTSIDFQKDRIDHTVKIVYTFGVLEVFLDDLSNPVLAAAVNLKSELAASDGMALVGFTAGTGQKTENHDILDWMFVTQVPNSNVVQNGDFSNDLLDWTPVRTAIVSGTRGEYPIFQTLSEMPAPSICTPVGRRGTTFLAMDTAFNASGYVEQRLAIPPNAHLNLVSWGWENSVPQSQISGLTNANVEIVDQSGVQHILDSFTPPPMLNVDPSNAAADTCTGNSAVSKTYDLSAFSGQSVTLRLGAQSHNCCGTLTTFADVDIEAPGVPVFQCPPLAGFKASPESCALPNASPNQPYSYTLRVTGGAPPYDFKFTGTLPPGLINEIDGTIHGTPTSPGVFSFNVTIQDQAVTTVINVPISVTVIPIVTGVSPAAGPVAGGTRLNVTGVGFSGAYTSSSVDFNKTTTSSYHVLSDSLIQVDSTPPSTKSCGVFSQCDVSGNDSVSVIINNSQSSIWCQHQGCDSFTYLPNDIQICSSSLPDGLVSLPGIRDENVRFHASLDASPAVADAELSGSIAINPQAGYCLHSVNGQLQSFNFTTAVSTSASLSASVSLTAQYDNLNNPYIIAGPFQATPLIAGPIIIVPTITPVLMISASLGGKMTGGFSYNSERTSSLTFNSSTSKWNETTSTLCSPDPTTGKTATPATLCLQPTTASMTIQGDVKIALGFEFSLLFYDIAGPVITPSVYLRLDGGFSTAPSSGGPTCDGLLEGTQQGSWGALCAGLEVSVGAQLNPWLGYLLPSTNWTAATFDLKSVLVAATVSASLVDQSLAMQTDGTFKLNPGQSTSITIQVAGSDLPSSTPTSSSWNLGSFAPTCGTLVETTAGSYRYTAPTSGGACNVEFKKDFLGLNLLPGATLSFRVGAPPSAPQNPSAASQSGRILLQWAAASSDGGFAITNYKVYRGTTSGSESLFQTLGPVPSLSDSSVVCGTTYFYKISAVNTAGEGSQSIEVDATAVCAASAPQNLAAGEAGQGIALSWQAPASDGGSSITGYKIYRGTSPNQESFLTSVGLVTSYTDLSVMGGTTYYYTIEAVNAAGSSVSSNEATSVGPQGSSLFPGSTLSGYLLYGLLGGVVALAFIVAALVLTRRKERR